MGDPNIQGGDILTYRHLSMAEFKYVSHENKESDQGGVFDSKVKFSKAELNKLIERAGRILTLNEMNILTHQVLVSCLSAGHAISVEKLRDEHKILRDQQGRRPKPDMLKFIFIKRSEKTLEVD